MEGFFDSEKLRLFYRYEPAPNERAFCMILHGHGEHAGRYDKFLRILNSEGISAAIFDYRGQGKSEGPEVYCESLADYLRDASAFLAFLRKTYSIPEKVIVHGNSLGALVAVHWVVKNMGNVRGMVLSSPCLGLKLPAPLIALNGFLNAVAPRFIYGNPVYPPHLTHDLEEMETYRKDPLIKRKISVRLVSEMLLYGSLLEQKTEYRFSFPVFMLVPDIEKVVDGPKALAFFQKIKAPLLEMRKFPGFYHELFHELGQDQAFEALRGYMKRIISFVPQP